MRQFADYHRRAQIPDWISGAAFDARSPRLMVPARRISIDLHLENHCSRAVNSQSSRFRALLLPLLWALGALGCAPTDLSWTAPLPSRAEQVFANHPEAEVQVQDALEHFFGQPGASHWAQSETLAARGVEPGSSGAGRLGDSPEVLEALRIDNRVRFEEFAVALENDPAAAVLPPELSAWAQRLEEVQADPSGAEGLLQDMDCWTPDLDHAATVYGRQCIGCHGRAGRGDGPSSGTLNPKPRDFASGAYKHYRADLRERPSQLELMQVIHTGVAGTGMAGFKRLGSAEISALADMVRWFGARGEFSEYLLSRAARSESLAFEDLDAEYAKIWLRWLAVDSSAETAGEPQ